MEEGSAEAMSASAPELTVTPTADPELTVNTTPSAENKRKMDRRKYGKPQLCEC